MKVVGERARARIVEHPLHLRREHFRILQPPLFGQPQQFVVGHGGPEEVGKPRRHVVLAQRMNARRAGALLDAEQERRRDQHGLQRQLDGFLVRIAALGRAIVERQEPLDLLRLHGPAVRLRQKSSPTAGAAALRGSSGCFARLHAEETIVQRALLRAALRPASARSRRYRTRSGTCQSTTAMVWAPRAKRAF